MKPVVTSRGQLGHIRPTKLVAVLAFAVASLLWGGVAAYSGGAALTIVPLLLLVLVAYKAPRAFVFVAIIGMLAARTLEQVVPVAGVSDFDEVLVVIAVVILPLRRKADGFSLRKFPGCAWFIAFFAVGALSSLVASVQLGTSLAGATLAIKGILFGFAVAQVDWRARDLGKLAKYSFIGLVVIAVSGLVNFISPAGWSRAVLNMDPPEARYGITPVTGLFVHPGYFGTTLSLGIVAIIGFRRVLGSSRGIGAILASIASLVLTFRRKVLGGLFAALIFVLGATGGLGIVGLSALGAPVAVFVGGDAISEVVETTSREYLSDPESVARVRLTLDAPGVAADYFPLGAGFGRFGSAAARSAYSPIYEELGYPSVWGLGPTPKTGKFLTDTFWPGVIGETGYVGSLCFLAGLFCIWKHLRRRAHEFAPSSYARWVCITASAWLLALLVESVAGATFSAVPTYGLIFGIVGIVTGLVGPIVTQDAADRSMVTAGDEGRS